MSPSALTLIGALGPALPDVDEAPPEPPPAEQPADAAAGSSSDADELPDKPAGADDEPLVMEPPPPDESTAAPAATPTSKADPSKTKKPPSSEAIERQSSVDLDDRGKRKRDKFNRPGSPQRFELEFKIGPYLPDVDRRYEGEGFGPYATIFGRTNSMGITDERPRPGVMPVLGFEWQFYYLGGPMGLGTQIGMFRDKAKAIIEMPEENENVRSAADDVIFWTIPVSLLAVYRFEMLADRFRIPIVPYAKGGVAYGFWLIKTSNGLAENSEGEKGRGGVWGWQFNAGGMLRLDFIERGTAKKLDALTGINHTYLFGEYQMLRLTNFGSDNAISVGDGTWFVGLAIEF